MRKKITSELDQDALGRYERLDAFVEGRSSATRVARVTRKTDKVTEKPKKSRATLQPTWESAAERAVEDAGKSIDPIGAKVKIENYTDYIGAYKNRNGTIRPEYDMLEAFTIYDTEVYVRQAITRRLALMFRNGYQVVSELEQNQDYINKRLDTMEYVMNRPTEGFLHDVLFNLLLNSNCFLLKIRDEKASAGVRTEKNRNRVPVAGYSIIPSHTIMPYLKEGRIAFWRRFYETGQPYEDFALDEIIHLKWDVKTNHIYGTPRLVGVRDDIFALRRLEENIELLFMNHLFPLFHVAVGTKEAPCTYREDGSSEIDMIKYQVESMPKEGVFVSDERTSINAVGAEGEALDTTSILKHLKSRVFTGLGVSPLDMGEADTSNRSTADNISQNLKDAIKADMETFSGLLRLFLFKEWFLEANYSLSVQKAVASTSLAFHEIDLDNKIKEQNHIIQLWLNNCITEDQMTLLLKLPKLTKADEKKTHYWMHIRDLAIITAQAKADAAMAIAGTKASPGAGTSSNKARPTNQHGTNPGPTKAKSSATEFRSLLSDSMTIAKDNWLQAGSKEPWRVVSSRVVDSVLGEFSASETTEDAENSYTRQLRTGIDRLKDYVGMSQDSEIQSILLDSYFGEEDEAQDERAIASEVNDACGSQGTSGASDPEPHFSDETDL